MKNPYKRANIRKEKLIPTSISRNWDLYLLLILPILYFVLIKYLPMYGVQIAFKNFSPSKGIFGSPWVGFKHFVRFFRSYQFPILIKNTLGINLYTILAGFPAPIILALALNEIKNAKFKKTVQMVTYAPHFLSTVVLVGMITVFLSPSTGLVNNIIKELGKEPIYFMTQPKMFKTIYVFSGIWQHMGFESVIYIAALSTIDVQFYEAATIDGANKFQKLAYITIPSIVPTAVIMLIKQAGHIMDIGFEKIFLMQNSLNISSSNVISTYVYEVGLLGAEFGFSAAVGLFNAVINFIFIIIINKISKTLSETSLW